MKYGSVYLIGPIRGNNYDESTTWREYVADQLRRSDITSYSPMRGKSIIKERLGDQKLVATSPEVASGDLEDIQLTSTKGINLRDYFDVRNRTLGFANFLGFDRISKGSILECGGFVALGKPLVVCMEEDNVHNHPLLNHNAFVCRSLEEGIWYTKQLLTPDCYAPYEFGPEHSSSDAETSLL